MEKIKNLINPGRKEDNETLYGSGTNTGTTGTHGGFTGEGSHLASNTGNNSGLAGSQTTGTSGLGSTNTGIASEASTDKSGPAVGNASTGLEQSSATSGLPGQGSHLAGNHNTTSGTSGLPSNQSLSLGNASNTTSTLPTTAGNTSGLTGNQGLGNTNTSSTGQSNLARDAAVTAAGTTAGSTGFAHHGNQHGSGRESGTEPLASAARGPTSGTSTTSSSHMPGSWDDSYEQGSNNTGLTGNNTSSGLGSNTGNVTNPNTQGTSQLGSTTGSSGISQHASTSSGHHLGRDAAAIGTAGAVGEGIHHHHENERKLDSNTRNPGSSTIADSGLGSATVFPTTTSHSTKLSSGPNYPSTSSGTSGYTSNLPDRSLNSQQPSATTGFGSDQTGTTSSNHHLGRDAAALGAAGAVGEGIHHHRDHERGVAGQEYTGTNREMPLSSNTGHTGSSGSQPLSTATGLGSNPGYGDKSSGNTTSDSHLGRDAAAIGTAGAIGEGIHHHRDHDSGLGSTEATSGSHAYGSASGPHSTNTANLLDPNISGGARTHEDAHIHDPRHGGGAEAADKHHASSSTSTNDSTSHHLGRDAAIGAGGVAAAGLAEYEYKQHEHNQGAHSGATTGSTNPAAPALTGRDPTSSSMNPTTSNSAGKDHHFGRDAAVGAGGVGAAGLAGREYEKHHEGSTGTGTTSGLTQSTSGSALPGPAPNTAGPHSKDWMNKLDPRVTANPTTSQGNSQAESALSSGKPSAESGSYGAGSTGISHPTSTNKDHHYGRDTAVGGGVGAAAYEAEKHHSGKHAPQDTNQLGSPGASAITGNPYPSRDASTTGNIAHKGDPTTDSERSKDHHYGRDAAVAEGVGGAAYEADKHYKHDKDLSQAERDAKKQHKHDEKELKKEQKELKHEQKEAHKDSKSGGGLFGFLHRDKNKKYTPEEDAEFDRQEREHNSHKGRDAALGTAGAGALGAGAYEAEKHHGQAGTSSTTTSTTPLEQKSVGTDLGDKLHGVERNRGVPGSSGLPGSEGYGTGSGIHSEASTDQYGNPVGSGVSTGAGNQSHLGRDAALGAGAVGIAGAGIHEHHKHDSGHQQGATSHDNQTSGSGLTGSHQGQHHYGRDAAAVGGVGGAAALGEHEYRKHEGTGSHTGSNLTGQNTSSGLIGSQGQHGYHQGSTGYDETSTSELHGSQGQSGHHLGRDAAAVGGVGALGEHEYRKHEGTSGQQNSPGYGQQSSGVSGSNSQYENTGIGSGQQQPSSGYGSNTIVDPANDGRVGPDIGGSNTSQSVSHKGPNVVEGSDGHRRLHKDPPASHPASDASHVSAGGSETQRMVQEGEQRIDSNTGVANSGNERTHY